MPLLARARAHVVRTYTVAAESWEEARVRVQNEEPGAEFVTIPVETATVLTEVTSMSAREIADLRSACNWREEHPPKPVDVAPQFGPRDVRRNR